MQTNIQKVKGLFLAGIFIAFSSLFLLPIAKAQDLAKPDLVIPFHFTVKVQLKSKKPIGTARTFDTTIVEIKDVLDDPTSVYVRGLTEGAALIELTSKDGDKDELRVLVIRQQIPVTNLDLVKKPSFPMDHLLKTLRTVAPDVHAYPLTSDSVYIHGEVLTLRELEIILRLASKIVDPGYLGDGNTKGQTYAYSAALKRGPGQTGTGAGQGGDESISFPVSVKVISGLRLKGEITSMDEKIAQLELVIRQIAPGSQVKVLKATSDSILLQGKVPTVDQVKQILQVASRIIDPDFNTTSANPSPKVISGLELDPNAPVQTNVLRPEFDLNYLRSLIRKAAPNSNIEIVPITRDSVILSGYVTNAADIPLILNIANNIVDPNYLTNAVPAAPTAPQSPMGQTPPTNPASDPSAPAPVTPSAPQANSSPRIVNAIRVAGVQQVQLDVVVAQVSRSEFRQLGFNFLASHNASFIASTLGNLASTPVSLSGVAGGGSGGSVLAANGLLSSSAASANVPFGVLTSNTGFLGFIQALRTENASKLLAEPKLVTTSGQSAYFLVGGRQAVLSSASGVNGPGATFQEVGTDLRFLPIVLGNGKIFLRVQPRVRSVNNGLGITTSFGFVPGFDEKQVETSVEMEAGQTLVLGGLIQNEVQGSTIKLPILGDLPFLGALFSTKSFNEVEQEVVILVTPHLVDPLSKDQVSKPLPGQETRAPDDFELFLEGILEAPRGARKIIQNRRYIPAFRNAPPLEEESGESRVPGHFRFIEIAPEKQQLPAPATQSKKPTKRPGLPGKLPDLSEIQNSADPSKNAK